MLPKVLVSILMALHLLPTPSKIPVLTPVPTVYPQQASALANQDTVNSNISVPDEVYADLALQHELDHVSVYYFDGKSENTVSVKSDKNWDPASTIKIYPAMYVFDQISRGKLSLDQIVTIDTKNVVASQSYPDGYPNLNAGDNVSVYRLVDQMITQSDNTAYNTLLDLLDRSQITSYIHDLGLTNSSIGAKLNLSDVQQQYELSQNGYGPNLITAADFAKAFIMINGGRIPGSSDLFAILARQKSNSMIPEFLPKKVTVAHKTGELDPDYHDGGIVADANRKYVLSVFTDMGDPNVVAHLSDLVFTTNVNLVGKNQSDSQPVGEIPNAPLDPIVANGELPDTSVLAANTTNIKLPKVTASDLGITAKDISGSLDYKQLPPVIVPADSPIHFLVDLGEQIRTKLNPIPSLRVQFETENLKLNLAEANDLINKGKEGSANQILQNVNTTLTNIAKDPVVSDSTSLQQGINQVSETRFSILGNEIANTQNSDQKVQLIKDVAKQALDTTENVKPYVADAAITNDLSQTPVVGQIVSTSPTSVTVKTPDGNTITTPVAPELKTRSSGQNNPQIESPTDLTIGSNIAIAGNSFALVDIASESAQTNPVTVIKVNTDTNTLVVSGADGVPQQIDLTSISVIKGADTIISLDNVQPGDVIVVHGEPIPVSTQSGTQNATESATPSSAPEPSQEDNNQDNSNPFTTPTPFPSLIPVVSASATPVTIIGNTPKPSLTPIPTITIKPTATAPVKPTTTPKPTSTVKPTATPASSKTSTPQVIKGDIIQVVQTVSTPVTQQKNTSTPSPVPSATPAVKK